MGSGLPGLKLNFNKIMGKIKNMTNPFVYVIFNESVKEFKSKNTNIKIDDDGFLKNIIGVISNKNNPYELFEYTIPIGNNNNLKLKTTFSLHTDTIGEDKKMISFISLFTNVPGFVCNTTDFLSNEVKK